MIARRAFIASLASACAVSVAFGASSAAAGTIEKFYRDGMRANKPVRAPSLGPRDARLTKSLRFLWARAEAKTPKGDAGPISFDPTTNSQGADVKSFTVTQESGDGKRAIVLAKVVLDNWTNTPPDGETVRYVLVNERGTWRIDDIRGAIADKPWSLREKLEKALRS